MASKKNHSIAKQASDGIRRLEAEERFDPDTYKLDPEELMQAMEESAALELVRVKLSQESGRELTKEEALIVLCKEHLGEK